MLETLSGRPIPRLRMDTERLAAALSTNVEATLKSSEPFLGTVADKVEEIIGGRKGSPYAYLSYDGSAPVSIDPDCRFAHVNLDVEVEGDTVLLLSDIIEEAFLRDYPSDRSLSICLANPTESKLIVSLADLSIANFCVATQSEIEVEPMMMTEINVYSSPDGVLYVVAGGPMSFMSNISLL